MGYAPSVNFNDLTLFLGLCATGVATSGSHTLSSVSFGTVYNPRTGITFEPSDVGMPIAIVGGGAVNSLMPPVYMVQGSLFHTTIDSYVSPTEVTLTDAPVTSFANTGFANIILYRPCPMTSDVATLASGAAQFQYNSSIAPGTSDTMQFTTLSSLGGSLGTDNPYVDRFGAPQLGQPVYLHSSVTGDVFGGYIDSLTTSSMPGVPGTPYCWSAQCASWMGLAKRRQVPPANPQSFTSADADVAFTAIVLDYLSDDGVAVSAPSGLPQINLACAVGANVGQLLDQVVSLVSTPDTAYYWTTDPWRTFILATRGAVNAPWDVVDGSDLFAGDTPNCQSITETHNQMANAVYGIGKQTILNTLNASFNGNGTATTFNVPEPVGTAPTITLNDSSQTVGVLGSTGSDWYWSQGSSVITQDSGGTVLVSTDILLVSYSPLVSAVAQNFNVGSLQSLQAIEGTSANYDYSFTIDNPILPADLLAMCTAYEIEYGLPAQTVSFYTLRPGLAVGQLQPITLLEAGISGSFLIATIQMSTMNNVIVWQYTAFGGANIGNAITALTQLINRQEASGIVAPSTPITPSTGASSVQQTPLGSQATPAVFPISVAKGDLLVVVLTCGSRGGGAGPLPSPTDTLGNSWTLAASYNGSVIPPYANQEQCGIYWSISTAAGADTVSIGGGVVAQFYAFEFSGVDTSSPVDVLSAGGTAQPLTTTKTYDLIITGMAGPGTTSPTVTSPETLVAFSGATEPPLPEDPAGIAVAQTIRDATGSFTSSLTPASPDAYQAFVSVAFAAAPTAPPAQTTNVLANPQGTVTHSVGALTSGAPVIGHGGGDITVGTKTGVTSEFVTASGAATSGAPLLYDSSGNAIAGSTGQLVPPGGTTNQVLTKNSGTDYDTKWASGGGGSSPLTTKGDLYGYSSTDARVPVGLNGQILTADSTQALGLRWASGGGGGNSTTVGPIASLPGSGTAAGDQYICTDSPYQFFWTGSAWQAFVYGYAVTPPVLSAFTQVNVGVSTFDTTHGGIIQVTPNGGSNNNSQVLSQDIPGSGAYYVDCAAIGVIFPSNGGFGCGLSGGPTSSDALAQNRWGPESGNYWQYERQLMNSPTSFNNNSGGVNLLTPTGPLVWMRVYDDRTTNRTFYISFDGYVWIQMYQESRTNLFTPNQAILSCSNYNSFMQVHWLHFSIHT